MQNNYAPISNHEIQKAMGIISDELFKNGEVLWQEYIEREIKRVTIQYDGLRYELELSRKNRCIAIKIL